MKSQEKTSVVLEENIIVTHEKRGIKGFITWWSKIKSESVGKDLVISTLENYDKIYVNGVEVVPIR